MFSRLLQRWEVSTSSGSHFQALDGLRGVAILLVVAHHTLYTNPEHGLLARLVGFIIAAGGLGVPVFFVLSGFLISYPFFQKRETDPSFWYQRGYARRRIGKILPPFYLSIVLFLVFYRVQSWNPAYLDSAWKWATGLGNFIRPDPIFNGSYWSLIVESHFYLLLPPLFWLTRGLSGAKTGLVIFAALFFVPLLARHLTWPAGVFALPDYTSALNRETFFKLVRFPCQLDYFAWGILFASVYVPLARGGLDRVRVLGSLGYAGAALLLVCLVFMGYWAGKIDFFATRSGVELSHFLPALAVMLTLFFVFDPQSLGARLLGAGWLRFTGIISYEWFLFHGPIVQWFHQNTGPTHGSVLAYAWRTLVPLVVTFVFSALVYRYFSLPVLNRVRDSLKKT